MLSSQLLLFILLKLQAENREFAILQFYASICNLDMNNRPFPTGRLFAM